MTAYQHSAPIGSARPAALSTRVLLTWAAVAAPLWATVSLAQVATREGFDLTRHPLSLLATGTLGWLQIVNFVLFGVLTVGGAIGLRRVLRDSPGGVWAPRLVGAGGVALIASGVLVLDPMDGFPIGTPAGMPASMSWHGVAHMIVGVGCFVLMSAACYVLGHHFGRARRRGLAIASGVAGTALLLGNGWAMAGGAIGSLTLAVGAITATTWISIVAAFYRTALQSKQEGRR